MSGRRLSVAIIQTYVPRYRQPFFEQLRERLADDEVELRLIYGRPLPPDDARRDETNLPWAEQVPSGSLRLAGRRLQWQRCLKATRAADLVVVEQASKLVANYLLLARQRLGGPPVALWGHGANLQQHSASVVGEWLKSRYSRMPHWWFAYTDASRRRVLAIGYPEDRITVVQNSVDTADLRLRTAGLGSRREQDFLAAHGLNGSQTCLFVGSLHADKRLEFLFEACDLIAAKVPGFELILAGDGPQRAQLLGQLSSRPYSRYVGRVDGDDKAAALAVSQLLLMPGLVGLAVLDGIATDTPMVTTDFPYHSPEIEYLVDGVNGRLVQGWEDPHAYADAVVELLSNEPARLRLVEGCRADAARYTIEAMAERFASGVRQALQAPRHTAATA
jgi:glycosyltransferase involved in cell wall biosynthesis